ncbi:hypothetical protein EZV62_008772 [Acer yangbiense]|uniref:4Fe-4S ferredoxin-type domain-containing protein n=1 Tax=Acer yangbiense TaxID=1000413 RepID=A0A5C7IDW3_9ROSI|nr:hypothetical protein EZV62_008772 [Acer yangbiense]
MRPKSNVLVAILVLLLLSLVVIVVQGRNSTANVVHHQSVSNVVGLPWLKNVAELRRLRLVGCRGRPWICRRREPPGTRMRCCQNQCVNVFGDHDNCGLCGFRCLFTRQCCRGLCTDTSRSRFNCGRCGNRCPPGVKCRYGMCGYAYPWPRPRPPRLPSPPQPSPMSTEEL